VGRGETVSEPAPGEVAAGEVAAGEVAAEPGGAPAELTWRLEQKVVVEGALAGIALLAAAITGDYVLVAFAVPLALASVLGLTRRRHSPFFAVSCKTTVVAPGEPIAVAITVQSRESVICGVALRLPPGLEVDGAAVWELYLRAGTNEVIDCEVSATRLGRFKLGLLDVTLTDSSGSLSAKGVAGHAIDVEARPLGSPALAVVRPDRVRATAGDRLARLAADGIEMADVREQPEGALGRRINWRATARRGVTCVNLQHPDRSTDVLLLVDTFAESEIPATVSVAISLAESYARRHDRLGLVCFGGVLDWVEPGTGPAHLEKVRSALLSSEVFFSYAWKTADIIPRRLFPAGCLVLAVSAMGDQRFTSALASLRSRGIDLAVIELAPPPIGSAVASAESRRSPTDLAARVVTMEREDTRRRFWAWGVPVVPINGPEEIAAGLAEIAAFRRSQVSRMRFVR
jgi:uncharacterized protein (DUF58 family)